MSTKDHNDTVAANTASTVTINSALHYPNLSIAQAIEQAIADSSKPSEQSLLGSALPNDLFKNPGLSQLEAHLGRYSNDPSSNPSQSDGHDPLSDLAGAISAARSRLTALDPTNQLDPTQKPALVESSLPSISELTNELASQLGIPASAMRSDPRDTKNQQSGSHHPERPDGPPAGDPAGTRDPNHAKVEGMLSADNVKHEAWDYTDKNGHQHHTEYWMTGKGDYANYDKDLKTGVVHQEVLHPNGSGTEQTTDPHKGTTKTTTTTADGTKTTTVVDTKVWKQGPVTISETKPGDPPLEPLHDDGKKSGGAKMPDGDHQTALPDWLRDEVRKELQAEIKSMHLPTHDTDNVNVRDDVPGTVSQGDLKGATVDKFHNILGGDTFGNPGIWQDRGTGAGSVPTNYNGIAGAIDYGPDHDEPPQSSGREERNTQHPIHTDPAAHSNGGGGNAQNTSGSLALSLIETATQEAAHQRDPWGTRGRYEQAADAPKDVAETPGQKAAHELQDALDRHDGPSQHEPIKSQEKLPGADLGGSLGHGPGHGGGLEADAASGFADLIRAAQNPREFGLAATAHVTTPDAVPHLAMNADLAGHLLPSHGTEDAHAAAASAIAVHDVHLDHHAVAMPVVDHIVAAHH